MSTLIKKDINASVILHVIKLSETWKKNGEKITRSQDITVQQWFILLLLANDPNINYLQENPQKKPLMAKEIAEALNVTQANVTNLLTILIEKKLILQIVDSTDKRRKRLKLSASGVKLVQKLEAIRTAYNHQLLHSFTKKEKEKFILFAKKCLHAMPH